MILILLVFLFFLQPIFSIIPFVPVNKIILDEIISALELNEHSILYDLGCGDARVLFAAAKRNKKISCLGIEIAPFPFLLSKAKEFFCEYKNVHIIYGNFSDLNISSATHIFLYLFPEKLDELLPKFEKELKAGTRVISCDFEFTKRKPNKIIKLELTLWQKNKKLYIYDF